MATVVSASSASITSILSTISTVARTAERSINTAAAGLDMLDTYVDSARTRQADKTKIDMSLYRENLIIEASLEQSRKNKQIQSELSSDQTLTKLFNEEYSRLSDLFATPA